MNIIETERTILRELTAEDAEFMLDLLNQSSFIKYIGDRNVRSVEESREFIETRYRASYVQHGFGLYAVELKETGEVIGINGFVKRDSLPDADIGFALLPQFEGQGLAFESAQAVLEYGKNVLNFKRVLAITSLDNESSGRLLEKLGFAFDGLIEQPHDTEKLKLFLKEF